MSKLKIFCTSIKHYKIIDRLPSYITPIGLGENNFPSDWIDEKKGDNLTHLNKYYGELTGLYWIWKNKIPEMSKNDMIGNCHYRKLWLDKKFTSKQKFSFSSLYSKLLNQDNNEIEKFDSIQVQPIIFVNKNLIEDFYEIHKTDILIRSLEFLDDKNKILFKEHLNNNILFPLNMFITKVSFFEDYCKILFPWLEKCLNYCLTNNLCKNYNIRLPAFLAERFTSYWFSQFSKKCCLSYARLGNVFCQIKSTAL